MKGFRIDTTKLLGKGQYSVYEATKHSRKYAAKFLCDKKIADLRDNELVLFDLGRGHPNVLQVENYCAAEPIGSWIFTECCHFGNLGDYSKSHSRDFQRNETKYEIMMQVTSGLDFLHSLNKVHRDIKPGNILVTTATGRYSNIAVKISDFGVSRTLDRTTTVTAVGSPHFAAPEIFGNHSGEARLNNKIDIYSLGLTFLAIIQGNRNLIPKGEGLRENFSIGEKMCDDPDYQPVELRPHDDRFTSDVKGILLKMLLYDSSRRPSTTDVLRALRDIGQQLEVRGFLHGFTD